MIAFLAGKIRVLGLNDLIVDVAGVGYRVSVPLSLMAQMPPIGQPVELYIHTQVREDAIQLFGFPAPADQELFELLITVNGVGPKVALALMSVLSHDQLAEAIASGESARLQRVPGVGAKTAQRVVLELKDKVTEQMWERKALGTSPAAIGVSEALKDVVEALMALGYPQSQARKAAEQAVKAVDDRADVGGMVRSALQILTSR